MIIKRFIQLKPSFSSIFFHFYEQKQLFISFPIFRNNRVNLLVMIANSRKQDRKRDNQCLYAVYIVLLPLTFLHSK